MSSSTSVPVDDVVAGDKAAVGSVAVRMSLTVIERFSQGLYSSPNKAFEELVSNSYDAGASRVWVSMPTDLQADGATVVVVDDGDSMDLSGLQDLWEIGESKKRLLEPTDGERHRIGKFGIGKLATFVLASKLTYLVHRDDRYLAVTMDYAEVRGGMSDPQQLVLDVVEVSEASAMESLRALLSEDRREGEKIDENGILADEAPVNDEELDPVRVLFHEDPDVRPSSWTAAILTDLKPAAHEIRLGRLRWILRTAVPLNPEFRLWFNGWQLTTSKITKEVLWTFTFGQDEGELENKDRVGSATSITLEGGRKEPAYKLPNAGLVWGKAILFKDSLQQGKSDKIGRSHGFFVRVRRRLINLDDPTFDLGVELSHGVLTRLHVVVEADGLDEFVAAPRESLQESAALTELKKYLLAIFNRARSR